MELEGLGVVIGVPTAMVFIPGAILDGNRVVSKKRVVQRPPEDAILKDGFPQDDSSDPFDF